MKFIYYTNNIIFTLTILGYTVLFPGLMMQAVLGGIQVLFFIILMFNYNKFSKQIKEHLLIYGTITCSFLLLFFFGDSLMNSLNRLFSVIAITIIPLSIAGYFTYIISKLQKRVL